MKIIKAPDDITNFEGVPSTIFLAGSIAMGEVEDWQSVVSEKLSGYTDKQVVVYNPRRDDFDTTAEQTVDNPYMVEQINWELNALDAAEFILVYFHPETLAPITLLELGRHANRPRDVVVCCPDGFYRQANVQIVCERFSIPFFTDLDIAVAMICDSIDYEHNLGRYGGS